MSLRKNSGRRARRDGKFAAWRLCYAAFGLVAVAVIIAYVALNAPSRELMRIRKLGQHDVAAAIQMLDRSENRSRDALLLRCQLFAAAGHWQETEATFSEISHPERCRDADLIALASQSLAAGIYSLADDILAACYKKGNHDSQLLRAMIDVKLQVGSDQEVLALCQKMTALAPDDPYPWLTTASIYQKAEKIDFAIAAFQEALRRNPQSRDEQNARLQIVDLAMYAGDLATASQQLDEMPNERQADPNVRVIRAKLLHRTGDFPASRQLLDKLLASNPEMVAALLERGMLHVDQGDFSKAVRDLEKVVAIDPENYTGHYKLGLAYQMQNQPSLADRHLQYAREITDRISERQLRAYARSTTDQ